MLGSSPLPVAGPLEMQKMLQSRHPGGGRRGGPGVQMSPGLSPIMSPITPGLNMALNAVSPVNMMMNQTLFTTPTFNTVRRALFYYNILTYFNDNVKYSFNK